jgi:tropomyosin, fungi type
LPTTDFAAERCLIFTPSLRQTDVKAGHFERKVQALEQTNSQLEQKYDELEKKYKESQAELEKFAAELGSL